MRVLLFSFAVSSLLGCVIRDEPPLRDRDAGPALSDTPPFDGGFACIPGVVGCFGNVRYRCGADGRTRDEEVACERACDVMLGCVACVPGTRDCDGTASMICVDDGSGYVFGRDCADWDTACGDDGYCDDACAIAEETRSYVGCEYFATPLANFPNLPGPRSFDFRVVVTNPDPLPAEVTITRGTRLVAREQLVPGAVLDLPLPWIDAVTFPFDGGSYEVPGAVDGAYRIRSSRPVIAAQFNPFHYVEGFAYSYSNDASLLLPVHALGTEYVGLSYPPLSSGDGTRGSAWPGFLALVGVTPEPARVSIVPSVALAPDAAGRWDDAPAGRLLEITLVRGEVIELVPATPPTCGPGRPGFSVIDPERPEEGICWEPEHDLTGTRVTSDRPIEAFGGHTCAYVPFDVPACDHLEETLAPIDAWGTEFQTLPLGDPEHPAENLLRIVAGHDGTEVHLSPPPDGVPSIHALDAGEHLDLTVAEPITIDSTRPIQVGQFLLGQNLTDPPLPRGDPALTMLVPQHQFRSRYVFVTPTSYTPATRGQSWILVSRSMGAEIELDGAPLEASWTTVGSHQLALVSVGGGTHRATGTSPFGLVAFGLGTYTSYAYPAGLDLQVAPF